MGTEPFRELLEVVGMMAFRVGSPQLHMFQF